MTNAIEAAAMQVAAAVAQLERTRAELAQAESGRRRVADRIEVLENERANIIARRRAGAGQGDDGAQLELIRADLEGLADLLRDADRQVAAAQGPHVEADRAVHIARAAMQRVEQEIAEQQLVAHAGRLDELLRATLGQLRELHGVLGRGKPVWAPSVELYGELRRLAAAGGRL